MEWICFDCIHLHGRREGDDSGDSRTCDAFPNGIPTPILNGQVEHTIEIPGDSGIIFEPIEKEKPTNYSGVRDSIVSQILYFFPVLRGPQYVTDRPADPALMPKVGTVPVYDGRRAAIDREHVAPNAGVAAEVLKKPIAVFVEILEAPGTNETASIETFVGVIPSGRGTRRLVTVRTNQGVVSEVAVASGESNAAIWQVLKAVRGIPAFQVPFP